MLKGVWMPKAVLLRSLLGFNVGVEIGQLVIVILVLPVIYRWRNAEAYRRFLVPVGSALVGLIACGWLIDRIFQLNWMPF